jgi:hypothetical protein
MVITFQPDARQRAQLIWSCAQSGIHHEPGRSSGTLACHFDDATELMAWHRAFVRRFGWAPMDIEVRVTEAEADF